MDGFSLSPCRSSEVRHKVTWLNQVRYGDSSDAYGPTSGECLLEVALQWDTLTTLFRCSIQRAAFEHTDRAQAQARSAQAQEGRMWDTSPDLRSWKDVADALTALDVTSGSAKVHRGA